LEDLGVDGGMLAALANVVVMKNTSEWQLKGLKVMLIFFPCILIFTVKLEFSSLCMSHA
jgi:hypothetical protein